MLYFTITDTQEIEPITYDWRAVKWVSNNDVAPGCEQSFELVHILPGKTNPKNNGTDHPVKTLWMAHLLWGFVILLFASVAHARDSGRQRLRVTIEAAEVLTPTTTPQVVTVTTTGTGIGRHFGHLTYEATELLDFRQLGDPAFPYARSVVTDGQFTITAANGDTLTGTYDGVGLLDPSRPGFVNGTSLARLTGVTGRFRCAAGFAPFTLDINTATLTQVMTFDASVQLFCSGDDD